MGFREVGPESDRVVVARERLLEASLPGKRDPEVVAGLGIVSRNLQHLPEQLFGFRVLLLVERESRQIEHEARAPRREREGFAIQPLRLPPALCEMLLEAAREEIPGAFQVRAHTGPSVALPGKRISAAGFAALTSPSGG